MDKIPLSKFCSDHGQNEAARLIGCTQGAVSQMLAQQREIYFVKNESEGLDVYEWKEISKPRKSA
jgi:hypothetical protein